MSAHEQMRAMLDQLMGTGRDGMCVRFFSILGIFCFKV